MIQDERYDVALSFAGEDRSYAGKLADALSRRDIKVFYDKYKKDTLWGANLYDHFSKLYQYQADHCIMIISKHYAKTFWSNHERKAAQARAFKEHEEYILPVRLDDTEIPGILHTTGYLSWTEESAETIADIFMVKLGKWPKNALLPFYKARQKVQELAYQYPQTAELVSAGTLRMLYLNRDKYTPSRFEKAVLFRNLLLRGRGTHHKGRRKKLDTPTADTEPAPLG